MSLQKRRRTVIDLTEDDADILPRDEVGRIEARFGDLPNELLIQIHQRTD